MSNVNVSMDYRGFDISGLTGPTGPAGPLLDPFDEINVKTLNIVDDNNNPYYTMPERAPQIGGDGAVPIFYDNGLSTFGIHTEPAYLYMASQGGGADANSRGGVPFSDLTVTSLYNIIIENDLLGQIRMPKGTYLCTVSFMPYVVNQPTGSPAPTMYFSIDGSTDPKPPFGFFRTYGIYEQVASFSQIINIESPTQKVRLAVDNRANSAGGVDAQLCNVSITKIAPDFRTNLIPFEGEFYANINYETDAYINLLTSRSKQTFYMPYSLINRENDRDNTIIKQFNDPVWGNYNALELRGSASNGNFYTLNFSGNISFYCIGVEIKELKVLFQQSTNRVTWTNLDTPTSFYTNISNQPNMFANPIPINLTKYNYLPPTRYENSFIRVMIEVIPDNNIGIFGNAQIAFNDIVARGSNSYFSIFLTSTIANRALYNVDMRGNGYASFLSRGYSILKRPPVIPRPTPAIEGVPLQGVNSFFLLPLVVNNKTPTGNNIISNVKMVYRPNNLQNFFGPSLCELEFLTTVTNYPVTVRFNANFATTESSFCNIRWYLNGVSMLATNLLIDGSPVIPPNTTFDQTFTVTFPEITAGSTLFGIFQYLGNTDDTAELQVLNNNSITFGY
jgi:hypothetical protein